MSLNLSPPFCFSGTNRFHLIQLSLALSKVPIFFVENSFHLSAHLHWNVKNSHDIYRICLSGSLNHNFFPYSRQRFHKPCLSGFGNPFFDVAKRLSLVSTYKSEKAQVLLHILVNSRSKNIKKLFPIRHRGIGNKLEP